MNEEEAIKKHGDDKIEIYHKETTPLQFSIYKDNTKVSYLKVITLKESNGEERVIGLHYFGPAADEVMGGFALAMKLGLTKRHLDM